MSNTLLPVLSSIFVFELTGTKYSINNDACALAWSVHSYRFDLNVKHAFTHLILLPVLNRSVENAGVAFAKGANERTEFFFFKEINSNICRTCPDEEGKGLTISGTN